MLAKALPGFAGGVYQRPGLVPIFKKTVSTSVATVDIANTDLDWTYWDQLIFEVRGLTVVTDDVEIYLRIYDTTLADWQSDAADYKHAGWFSSTAGLSNQSSTGDPEISMMNAMGGTHAVGNAANETFRATIHIQRPGNATEIKSISWTADWASAAGNFSSAAGGGYYVGALNAISGLRLLAESGNIDACEITVYGVRGL